MKNNKVEKGRFNFLIDVSVYREFSKACKELGMIRSKAIENHMKKFSDDHDISNIRREKTHKKGRYNFLIDLNTYKEFSDVCDEIGLIRSKNIENFMRQFIEKTK